MKQLNFTLWATLSGVMLAAGLNAQDRIPADLRPFQLTIGLIEPSVIAEVRLSDQQTFVGAAAITLGIANDEVFVFPLFRGGVRHYYPRKRVKKTNLRQNSGNFVTLQGGYYLPTFSDVATTADNSYFIGPAWGFQRNYASGIHFSLSLGIGYGNGKYTEGDVAGVGHLTFGFTLK